MKHVESKQHANICKVVFYWQSTKKDTNGAIEIT